MKRGHIVGFCAFLLFLAISTSADETYFFWYGSAPDSVSWAPFDWEGQGRTSGFTTSISVGDFYNHTPDAADDTNLNRSLTFSASALGNMGAHHPTVLPGGIGTVSLWVYYDYNYGISLSDTMNTIYLSVTPGSDLVKGNYIGVEMPFEGTHFTIVSKDSPNGTNGPEIKNDDWNHLVFIDNGSSTKVLINDVESSVSLSTGGNLWYINFVDGRVKNDGTIEKGESLETWYFDDIECTSSVTSEYAVVDAPLTTNTVTIDGEIQPAEITGANQVTWDGSTTERPGVHAQFYGQWQLPTPADMTATAYLQNDGTMLYVSIDVVDDILSIGDRTSWWEEDSTELYIDYDNSHSTGTTTQISIRADNGLGNGGDFADWLTVESKVKADQSGWQFEAGIDMMMQGLVQNETYGFDISINDSDGENESGYQGAQEWLYASYEFAYSNETYWGKIHILNVATRIENWSLFE